MLCSRNGFLRATHATLRRGTREEMLEVMKELLLSRPRRSGGRMDSTGSMDSTVCTAATDPAVSTACRPLRLQPPAAAACRTHLFSHPSTHNREVCRLHQSTTNRGLARQRPVLPSLRRLQAPVLAHPVAWVLRVAVALVALARPPKDRRCRSLLVTFRRESEAGSAALCRLLQERQAFQPPKVVGVTA